MVALPGPCWCITSLWLVRPSVTVAQSVGGACHIHIWHSLWLTSSHGLSVLPISVRSPTHSVAVANHPLHGATWVQRDFDHRDCQNVVHGWSCEACAYWLIFMSGRHPQVRSLSGLRFLGSFFCLRGLQLGCDQRVPPVAQFRVL